MLYIILAALALFERLVFDLGPNIELVTLTSIMVGMYGKGRLKVLVPVVVMILSDLVLGIGWISVFTWSGMAVMTYLPGLMLKFRSRVFKGLSAGITGALIFYIWTNLGVWLTDQWGMYPHDVMGLIQCYINGLPFLKLHLFGVGLTVPLGIYIYDTIVVREGREVKGLVGS